HGVPLTFLIEVEPISPTRYEPIDRTIADEHLWLEEALEPLVGYQGDAVTMAYELANAARARLGAHWAAVLVAVQNDTDPDGSFPDGLREHAVLGGPYFVITVKPSNAASATVDYYIAHEMTHMFWALDEYPANNAWWSCTLRSGYFAQPNTNSDVPILAYCYGADQTLRRHCFMKDNYPDSLCDATARQIGWVDLDQTGVLDLLETRPTVRPDSVQFAGGLGAPFTIRGTAADEALPNTNPYEFEAGDSITIATVDSILYRVDGGPWTSVTPDDGIFDQGSERFTFLLPSPGLGNHLLEFQARNSSGRNMLIPASALVTVAGGAASIGGSGTDDAAIHPRLQAGPVPSAGAVRFSLAGRRGSSARARLYDVAGRVVRSWSLALPASGVVDWEWDGRLSGGAPGAGGLYFLVVETGPHRLNRRVVLLR
ncbi:MAG TPA: FlgD immunoglobulin-like domain containing protein, partial [Candidatus Dormibacteraeota bacterium]|nr:FlgD immunoglobulin-like domain containing protein [Candidatus Dormibacteraeota bacterium]